MAVMDRHFEHASIVASACSLLRQLAKSDTVKKLFVSMDGFATLEKILDAHKASVNACSQVCVISSHDCTCPAKASTYSLAECLAVQHTLNTSTNNCTVQALGLLATVLLRQPEHCDAANANERLMTQVVDAMLTHRSSPAVMRQACQVVRNLVVRNTHLRQPMLQRGVEPVLRGAKKLTDCGDVALAALRDLGLDDYNA